MKKKVKRLFAIMLASLMLVATAATPVMAEDQDTPVTEIDPSPQSVGPLLASNATGFSGGSGTLQVYLTSGNWFADIMAGTANTGASGVVACYVTNPSGDTTYLGTILASNAQTPYIEFTYCGSGTYTFYFEATSSNHIEVYGRIFD